MGRLGLVLLSGLLVAQSGRACSIPVFRYALEKWAPSKYELVVFHKGQPAPEEQKRIKSFRDDAATANLLINTIDLTSNLEPNIRKIWERLPKDILLPYGVLRYPEASEKTPHVWAGPLASPELDGLLISPGRAKLFGRLTMGDTAAIILLLSGDAKADEAARAFLAKEVPYFAKRITLPIQTMEGPQIKSLLPLDIRFNVVELNRTGDEAMVAAMLLNSEDGLPEEKGPIAFPVYGRGRALCSLHGDDLKKPDELQRAMEFVCRACSCQVKELNPGIDLLIHGDWEEIFEVEKGPAPRITTAVETTPAPQPKKADAPEPKSGERPVPQTPLVPEYRTPPPADYQAVEVRTTRDDDSPSRLKPYLLAGAAFLVLLSGVWVWRSRRPRP
ncbi:hypothetical protein [Zavarzinella formosa]|uniref:hypothetical protein n=1 Tax=Zavarzinella formosa TaxID=360055 RepID=UPI0003038102|nr:hypothetical protein [Zavarzinella formosa]